MNLRVTIIEINTEGDVMTNWIDDLSKDVKDRAGVEERQKEYQLHKERIIKGKLPAFWRGLEECVDRYCAELKEKTDNKECHCTKISLSNGFTLKNDAHSLRRLSVRHNADAQSIEVLEEVPEKPRYSPTGGSEIRIDITNDDRLVFQWRGQNYFTPEDLSEALVKPFVLGAVNKVSIYDQP